MKINKAEGVMCLQGIIYSNGMNHSIHFMIPLKTYPHIITINCLFVCHRWGNTPLDEARVGGSKKLIKLMEDAILDAGKTIPTRF